MAGFECKCGNVLSNTNVPNEIEYHVYSDFEWDKILQNDTIMTYEIPSPNLDVWKCPNCERIHIFDKDGERVKTYKIETDY